MQTRTINPSPWLQAFNINHGVEVTDGQRTLYLSGQTSTAGDGTPMHAGDLVAQFTFAWSNLKDALAEAGMSPANVTRLTIYTTDVDGIMGAGEELFGMIAADACSPAATLIGVARLYDPSIMVEIEGTAVA
jgi:enamine deaminase RidA (YjgF/YER057c/UK114 family)